MNHSAANIVMLLAAAIWGFAFVAQKSAMDSLGPFSFNAIRFILGAACLHIVFHYQNKLFPALKPVASSDASARPEDIYLSRQGWVYAGLMGLVLFLGANTQQIGLVTSTAGKSAFITGLYIVIVPVAMSIRGQRFSLRLWLSVLIVLVGLYLLSVTDGFQSVELGDVWVLVSAFLFALHILIIGRASKHHDAIKLSIVQFYICAILSAVGMLSLETISLEAISDAWLELLYAGVLSVAIAYTLQVVGQQYVASHIAALILSLEAVFGALGGYWLLDESMSARMIWGCGLMLLGWVLAQLQPRRKAFYSG